MSMSMVTSVLSGTSALNIRTCCRRCCLNCFNLHLFLPSTLSSINRGAKRQDKHASFDNKIWYYNMQPHDCPLSARLTQPLADNACVQSSSYMIVSVCLFKTCWIRKLFFFFFLNQACCLYKKNVEGIVSNTAPWNTNMTMTGNLGTSRKSNRGVVCK